MSKIGWPVIKAKAIFLTGKQGDFGDARKRSFVGIVCRMYKLQLKRAHSPQIIKYTLHAIPVGCERTDIKEYQSYSTNGRSSDTACPGVVSHCQSCI